MGDVEEDCIVHQRLCIWHPPRDGHPVWEIEQWQGYWGWSSWGHWLSTWTGWDSRSECNTSLFSPASHSLVPLPGTSPIHTMHNLDAVASDGANSESAPDSETTGPTTHKQKHKSKAMIVYKKLAFNKCQATDRQCTKDSLDPDVNVRPRICKRHVASATPSMVHCSA